MSTTAKEVGQHYNLGGHRDTYLWCPFCGSGPIDVLPPESRYSFESHLVLVHNAAETWAQDTTKQILS